MTDILDQPLIPQHVFTRLSPVDDMTLRNWMRYRFVTAAKEIPRPPTKRSQNPNPQRTYSLANVLKLTAMADLNEHLAMPPRSMSPITEGVIRLYRPVVLEKLRRLVEHPDAHCDRSIRVAAGVVRSDDSFRIDPPDEAADDTVVMTFPLGVWLGRTAERYWAFKSD